MSKSNDKPPDGYSQQWSAYNKAQMDEKRLFQLLLYELCAGIKEPEQDVGNKRLSLTDMIFSSVFKTYTTFSTRRFTTDLREAQEKGFIRKVPHFNSISHYLRKESLTPYLELLIEISSLPLKSFEIDFAADSTGFSTYQFYEWCSEKYGTTQRKREWLKVHVMCGVRTNIITTAIITSGHESDYRQFKRLVDDTARNFKISEVSADAGYLGAENMLHVLLHGGMPYIAFKSNSTPDGEPKSTFWKRMLYLYKYRYPEFSKHYHKRNNVEATFSMLKAKFGDRLRSKSQRGCINESLCKILCHNLCVIIQSMYELGIDPMFDIVAEAVPKNQEGSEDTNRMIAEGRIIAGTRNALRRVEEAKSVQGNDGQEENQLNRGQLKLFD